MSAEIFILSGARAGERIVLDATEFRVGGEADCEVFFDPQQDLPAKGRSALFRLMDDGWSVACTGSGELLVNQTVISGQTRIRSGDVLRMSNEGPAFSFAILTRAAAAATSAAAARKLDSHPASRTAPPSANPAVAPASARPVAAQSTAGPTPAPSPAAPSSAPATAPPAAVSTRKIRPIVWAAAIGGGLAIIVLAVCVTAYVMTPLPITPPDTTSNAGHAKKMDPWRPKREQPRGSP